ncbi:hypothetical protein O6H91_08G073100 [Diphasiastrum complanatum]|uniref:Uncharacterized protein n=1 Tax=Diphasiastrum complanatum TaxID=34168 RepID=A0ACC2CYV2_DIPCM|nr:hypothetical protein O6H91_08G073100 [Diphasiastrum complanatum]
MVGTCLRLPSGRFGRQRSVEKKQTYGFVKEASSAPTSSIVDPVEEILSVEHPMEPPDDNKPIRCPLPEPCIVHDGRIWKERAATNSLLRENSVPTNHQYRKLSNGSFIHPSSSAPERTLITLLE